MWRKGSTPSLKARGRLFFPVLVSVVISLLAAGGASAELDCRVCSPTDSICNPAIYTVNIFNISWDGSVFVGNPPVPSREVRCNETTGGQLSAGGAGTVLIRVSDLQAGHAEESTYSNYIYDINLSSSDRNLDCSYVSGDCASSGWQTCAFSLTDATNAHVGNCSQYAGGPRVCCNSSYSTPGEIPVVKLGEHKIYISLGETHHMLVYVGNKESYPDTVNLSLGGTYPQDLAVFLESSAMECQDAKCRNMSVYLNPLEQKTLYIKIDSTDIGNYDLTISGVSEASKEVGSDAAEITIGLQAAFPGIELLSALMIVAFSAALYGKSCRKRR